MAPTTTYLMQGLNERFLATEIIVKNETPYFNNKSLNTALSSRFIVRDETLDQVWLKKKINIPVNPFFYTDDCGITWGNMFTKLWRRTLRYFNINRWSLWNVTYCSPSETIELMSSYIEFIHLYFYWNVINLFPHNFANIFPQHHCRLSIYSSFE